LFLSSGGQHGQGRPLRGPVRRRRAGHHVLSRSVRLAAQGVDDLDDALARVEKLGGKVAIGRQPVGTMGYSAYFHDTEGNLIGLWQNA
jgi:predicted enzyme related to lactoylglutathione lyase